MSEKLNRIKEYQSLLCCSLAEAEARIEYEDRTALVADARLHAMRLDGAAYEAFNALIEVVENLNEKTRY
jgi:hypothetical protein